MTDDQYVKCMDGCRVGTITYYCQNEKGHDMNHRHKIADGVWLHWGLSHDI